MMRFGKKLAVMMLVFGAAALTPALATICVVPDSGGTADMPPTVGTPDCTEGYVSPQDAHEIIAGLPPGSSIIVGAEHFEFGLINSGPGGNLGGEFEQFTSILQLNLQGQGPVLGGFQRTLFVPVNCETHIGPRTPGDAVQTFPNEMVQLEGSIFGDPDFDFLTIRAGSNFGLPSPGQTTLKDLGNGTFNVDSFFDITYQIEFQGAPGSILEGSGGVTEATAGMQLGEPAPAVPMAGTSALIVLGAMIALALTWMVMRRRAKSVT